MGVRVERDGAVLRVVLARAARRNALTVEMLRDLETLADGLAADGEVRAVVLMAEGPDFSVGMDLAEMEGARPPIAVLRRVARQGARTGPRGRTALNRPSD